MLPELAEPGSLDVRSSLIVVLGLSVVFLIGFGHALLRWRRHGAPSTKPAALSYRGWSIAFLIGFCCLHVAVGDYWLRLACGEVFEAEVQRTTQSIRRGTISHRLIAVSLNDARWSLEDGVSAELVEALTDRTEGRSGPARPVHVTFVVVPFWPAVHQIGSAVTVHAVQVVAVAIGFLLLLLGYGLGAPRLERSHGGATQAFLDGLAALAGATAEQLLEVPACLAVAWLVAPRIRDEPLSAIDGVPVLVLGGCLWVLLERILRPGPRELSLRLVQVPVPSSSVFHLMFDAVWLWLGIGLLQPPRSDIDWGLGLGFTSVPGLLTAARLLKWRHRYRPEQ